MDYWNPPEVPTPPFSPDHASEDYDRPATARGSSSSRGIAGGAVQTFTVDADRSLQRCVRDAGGPA